MTSNQKSGGRVHPWLPTRSVADGLGVSQDSVRYWIDNGRVRGRWRDGRWEVDSRSLGRFARSSPRYGDRYEQSFGDRTPGTKET